MNKEKFYPECEHKRKQCALCHLGPGKKRSVEEKTAPRDNEDSEDILSNQNDD